MKVARTHWFRAFVFGLMAEFATVVVIIITVVVHKNWISPGKSVADYDAFSQMAGLLIGSVLGALFVFLLGWALVRAVSTKPLAHGMVVGLGAAVLQLGGEFLGHMPMQRSYFLAAAAKIATGALAGLLASRVGRPLPTTTEV
jgi:hypothetical protein